MWAKLNKFILKQTLFCLQKIVPHHGARVVLGEGHCTLYQAGQCVRNVGMHESEAELDVF